MDFGPELELEELGNEEPPCDDLDAIPDSLRFNIFDMICVLISIGTFFFDVGMDWKMASIYYSNNEMLHFGLTLIFVILPGLAITGFSLRWYIMDLDNEHSCSRSRPKWVVRSFFLVFQLGPVLRYAESFLYGLKSRKAKEDGDKELQRQYYTKLINEDSDATFLRLIECFTEACPQVILQICIISVHLDAKRAFGITGTLQVITVVSSVLSVAWALMSYQKALRYAQPEKKNISWSGAAVLFIWYLCEITARISAIGMFASCFPQYLAFACLLHWLGMLCWLLISEKQTWSSRCEETVFCMIVAFIYIFTFFNTHDEPTRYKYLCYYLVCFIENVTLMCIWFFSAHCPDFGQSLRITIFAGHFVLFVGGIVFMVVYYLCCHPTSRNQQKSGVCASINSRRVSLAFVDVNS